MALLMCGCLGLIVFVALRRKNDFRTLPLSASGQVERGEPGESGAEPSVKDGIGEVEAAPKNPSAASEPRPESLNSLRVRGVAEDAESGQGLPNLTLWIAAGASVRGSQSTTSIRTGPDGSFDARISRAGTAVLVFTAKDPGCEIKEGVRFDVPQGTPEFFARITIKRRSQERIAVRGAGGRPLPGARVDWWTSGGRDLHRGSGLTDAEGCIDVPLSEGELNISAVFRGYGRGFLGPIGAASGTVPTEPQELVLREVAPATGRIIDGAGRGVEGVRLQVLIVDNQAIRATPRMMNRLVEDTATTDADGGFTLLSASPDSLYRVRATGPGGAVLKVSPETIRGGSGPLLLTVSSQ